MHFCTAYYTDVSFGIRWGKMNCINDEDEVMH